jgi:sterol desaturase/sphingolipid hydroxylase (fatty acid hydroxylase superfamily)
MKIEDIMGLMIPLTWLGMLVLEGISPRRTDFPKVKAWRWIGAASLLAYMIVGIELPLLIPESWLAYRLIDASRLSVIASVIVGYLLLTFIGYWYHRACHKFDFMWRWSHQIHHSATRLDISGSLYFHPFEMIIFTLIQVGVLVFALGLSPLAAAIIGYVGAFYGLFQHLNIRTPRWLGFLIQRPESHGFHHQIKLHAYNYSDLPIWDILFGTFKNPITHKAGVGFGGNTHRRFLSMLFGQDISGGTGTAVQKGTSEIPTSIDSVTEVPALVEG